jgi:hypothetical protein
MTEHMDSPDDSPSNSAAAVAPDNLDAQRKKYSRMLSNGLFDDHQPERQDNKCDDEHIHEQKNKNSADTHQSANPDQSANPSTDGSEDEAPSETDIGNRATLKKILILTFGVFAPALALVIWGIACTDRMTLLLLKHPVEFLIEAAAILNIPIANYLVWRATSRQDLRFPLRNGVLIGMAAGTALLVATVATVAVWLGYPTMDIHNESRAALFTTIAAACVASCITSVVLAAKLRNLREFRSARKISLLFSIGGLVTAILVLIGAETKPFLVRVAESNATSDVVEERDAALRSLKQLNAERDIMMECADQRAAGIPGMFIKMDPVMQRQAYFMLTGKPFRDEKASDYSAMPDDYLKRHVVGVPIENLSLARSAMTGTVNGDNLVSSLNWTFVLKNRNYSASEARAEIMLPHGAVINDVTQWAGEGSAPRTAHVGLDRPGQPTATRYLGGAGGTDVTDLGHDRILIRCSDIPAQSETKLSISIAAPLSLNNLKSASLTLPKFVDTNFSSLSENTFRLRSRTPMTLEGKDGKEVRTVQNGDGDYLISDTLKSNELKDTTLTLDTTRDASKAGRLTAYDKRLGLYFTRSIVATKADTPKSLMIVIDGSLSMSKHIKAVVDSLKKLPSSISTSVLIASADKSFSSEPLPLSEALKEISAHENAFAGGQDNLQTVVKAAGIAGESKNGAVLWIHGPQAGLNNELYITTPYTEAPKFYEISVDRGADDAAQLFKNHREIGPFTTISRSNDLAADLKHFADRWQPGTSGYELSYLTANKIGEDAIKLEGADARDFTSICVRREYESQIKKGNTKYADYLAFKGNIVTPDTSAVIAFTPESNQPNRSENTVQTKSSEDVFQQTNSGDAFQLSSSEVPPGFSGATNGTIGPQGTDATYVTGVNTSGTVRVNNLANLEAMLNILANSGELLGILGGGYLIIASIFSTSTVTIFGLKLTRLQAAAIGFVAGFIGLAIPGMINFMVASARDANLFS